METTIAEPVREIKPLKVGPKEFKSRLIVGTGKYESFDQNRMALEISGADA